MDEQQFLMASGAGRVLKRSAETVRYYERTGRLPALRTERGVRLFLRADVERLARELAAGTTEQNQPAVA